MPEVWCQTKMCHIIDILPKSISFSLIEEEIKERIVLGTKAYYANLKFFKSRLVTKQSKVKLFRTVIRTIVTYATETWALKETNSETISL
jgi:hypothetical protein